MQIRDGVGKMRWAILLASTLIVTGATTTLAQDRIFTKWVCVLDLEQALTPSGDFVALGPLPREVRTTNSTKKCTGSAEQQTENIQIDCTAALGTGVWRGGNRNYDVDCQIFQGQCGQAGFRLAQIGKLNISQTGALNLSCNRN
jgi:hypothetical protein